MEEIKAIAAKYDIGAVVILHTPGFSEYWLGVSPSYSGLKINGNELKLRIKRADFKSDSELIEQRKNTSNMVEHLTGVSCALTDHLLRLQETVAKHIKADHTGGHHTSQHELDN